MGQRDDAISPLLEAIRIWRELVQSNSDLRFFVASALSSLGITYNELGQPNKAVPPTLEAIAIIRKLASQILTFLADLTKILINIGVYTHKLGKPADAGFQPAFLADLALALSNLGTCYAELGMVYVEAGQRAEGIPPTQEAIKILRQMAQTNPPSPRSRGGSEQPGRLLCAAGPAARQPAGAQGSLAVVHAAGGHQPRCFPGAASARPQQS